jgi:hypothetical protein
MIAGLVSVAGRASVESVAVTSHREPPSSRRRCDV